MKKRREGKRITGEESLQENGREEENKKDGGAASVRVKTHADKYINLLRPSSFVQPKMTQRLVNNALHNCRKLFVNLHRYGDTTQITQKPVTVIFN